MKKNKFALIFNSKDNQLLDFKDETFKTIDCNDILFELQPVVFDFLINQNHIDMETLSKLNKKLLLKFKKPPIIKNIIIIWINNNSYDRTKLDEILTTKVSEELALKLFVKRYFSENLGIQFVELEPNEINQLSAK